MTHSGITQQYNTVAPDWNEMLDRLGYHDAYCSFIETTLRGRKPATRICDIGAGSGGFAKALISKLGAPEHLSLVDPSTQMLSYAEQALQPNCKNISNHCETLQSYAPDQPFDIVLAAHIIEHCPDPPAAMRKLWRLVAPEGALLLIVSRPHWCQWLIWLRWRHRWFASSTIQGMAAGSSMPAPQIFRFATGIPQRTSLGYVFFKQGQEPEC